MKRIVAGIDFSKTSVLALRYASRIAQHTGSELLLVNVKKHLDYQVPLSTEEKNGPEEVVEQFERLIEDFREELPSEVEYAIRDGIVHKEISNQAKYSNAWLIVIGAHGLSGFQEYWMGSESYRIVATALNPVISVRQSYDITRPLKKIIIPVDSTFETIQKAPFTLDLAAKFGADVYILSLYSNPMADISQRVDANTHEVMRQAELSGIKMFVESRKTENITNATIDFAEQTDADLISIMTEQEFSSKNILLGSYAQQMVNHSPIPVLTMHSKEIIKERQLTV